MTSYILLGSILLIITTLIIFHNSPKDKTTQFTPITPSPVETRPFSPSSSPQPLHVSDSKALALYDQGLKLYYQRNFPEALDLFNQALTIDAQCYEAINAKGATLAFQGLYDQGLALIQQALNLNPLYVYGHFNLGLANELAGRWDPAITAYQKAIELDDRDTWSYYGIASIYGRLGNIDKVVEYLQPAIALDPDVKEVARDEHDFAPVRDEPRFQTIVAP
ncbi:tetratricopeptide repeat protein [Desulfosporosinus fructosivorans]|uniref:Tetratricopeptide repeat protein n=2 Tax=Desulfosporosinus fructosivorans TaxID=2018669 RepID=A0A4Z0R2S5_9FIRM|nr:tetratricopeptide repeat protein [Desulfosporosinus fructosivorans]